MMKRFCLLAMLIAAVSCGTQQQKEIPAEKVEPAAIENFNVEQFAQLIKDTTVVLLDVRTPEEFAQECIQGALNINVKDSLFMENVQAAIPAGARVAVYCRSGRRSMLAAEQMLEKGYAPVNLEGGILAWKEAEK